MEEEDYGPVFRIDSSQRKNDVIIYDSRRYPSKSSEHSGTPIQWFFARKNKNTRKETYRCAACRTSIEKSNRDKVQTAGPGARIIVRENRFKVDPDFPLGEHICNFESNPNCDRFMVWARRALLKANSELRLSPERPKLKFQQLLDSIREGRDEYAHLDQTTRSRIVQQLSANKGFDSRRRSFARNNSLAVKRLREDLTRATDAERRSLILFENRRKIGPKNGGLHSAKAHYPRALSKAQLGGRVAQYGGFDSSDNIAVVQEREDECGPAAGPEGDFVGEIIVDGEVTTFDGMFGAATSNTHYSLHPAELVHGDDMDYRGIQQMSLDSGTAFIMEVEKTLDYIHHHLLGYVVNSSPAKRDAWHAKLQQFAQSNCRPDAKELCGKFLNSPPYNGKTVLVKQNGGGRAINEPLKSELNHSILSSGAMENEAETVITVDNLD